MRRYQIYACRARPMVRSRYVVELWGLSLGIPVEGMTSWILDLDMLNYRSWRLGTRTWVIRSPCPAAWIAFLTAASP